MTDDKLYTNLSANTIMAKQTNHIQWTTFITSLTDKHYSLDSEDDFRSGCRNISHQQPFLLGYSHLDNDNIQATFLQLTALVHYELWLDNTLKLQLWRVLLQL